LNDTISDIKGRRSIRVYQEKAIPEEQLNEVLESIRWSPSWANSQCWEVVLVKDPARKERLREVLAEKNPAKKAITQAPVVIALCAKREAAGYYKDRPVTNLGDWYMFDLGLAAQNLCLSAHSLGLGTVIVGALDHEKGKEVLGVKEGYELVALIPLGFPAKDSPAPRRREIKDFVRYEVF
jgi:nitroreductase